MRKVLALVLSFVMVVLLMCPAFVVTAVSSIATATCVEWCGGNELWGTKDGVVTGDWNAACFTTSENPYVIIDLGSVQRINQVNLWPVMAAPSYFGTDYHFEVSEDGTSYKTVHTVTGDVNAQSERIYKFPTANARFVKLVVDKYAEKDASGATFGLRGFFVYPSTRLSDTASVVRCDGDQVWGGAPENLLNDNWGAACFTNAEKPVVVLDLGKLCKVDQIVTWPCEAAQSYYPTDYTFAVSEDGVNYTTVYTATGDVNAATERSYPINTTLARYVKMEVTAPMVNAGGATFGLRALWVYGSNLPGVVDGGDYYTADNDIFTYYGRWTETETGMKAGWGTSKMRFNFTGTKFDVMVEGAADGVAVVAHTAGEYPIVSTVNEGVVSFTFQNGGEHEVLLMTDTSSSKNSNLTVKGIEFEKGAAVKATALDVKTVEIIGDSISDGWFGVRTSSYITDTKMDWESINIAYAGITLTDTWNWAAGDANKGLESMYFQATNSFTDTTQWSFPAANEPDYIYINIGTNDYGVGITDAAFQATYRNFLVKLREKNPNATIFCVSPYGGFYEGVFVHAMETPIAEAVKERQLAGDQNVYYIDTKGLLEADTARNYLADDLHPAETQFEHFANWIAPRLTAVVNETAHTPVSYDHKGADCGNDGHDYRKCSVCGMHIYTKLEASGEHTEGDWVYDSDTHTRTKSCTVCGEPLKSESYKDDLSAGTVAAIDDVTFQGEAICPEVVVTVGGVTLQKDVDYTVSYENNDKVGTAKVVITGKGNYEGTLEAQFTIKEAPAVTPPVTPAPPTGDSFMLPVLLGLMALSALAVTCILSRRNLFF